MRIITMHTRTRRIVAFARIGAVMAGLLALTAVPAAAQRTSAGPRWQAWLGCWTAAPAVDAIVPATAGVPLVCITPTTSSDVVEIATIAGGKVLSMQRLDAGLREQPVEAKGCTGTRQARWSSDGRRVYLKSVATCDGVQRTTTGILAMTPSGEWLDIQGIAADGAENVRVARYRDAGVSSVVPDEIASALRDRKASSEGARVAAGAPVRSANVVEASGAVSAAVTEAWLLERGQAFALDAHELVTLADAGVPGRVTDALVAVSNPQVFAVEHSAPGRGGALADSEEVVGQRIRVYMEPSYSPWSWGYSPYGYGYGYYSAYGYSPYGRYSPYGYNGLGGYGYGYSGAPIIIVNGSQPAAPHGRMVKGRGYTQRDPASTPSQSMGSSSSTSSATSSGSSSSAPSAPAAAPAPARTAHPRP
jgi:hypothetical protein